MFASWSLAGCLYLILLSAMQPNFQRILKSYFSSFVGPDGLGPCYPEIDENHARLRYKYKTT